MNRDDLASRIEHACLMPNATAADIGRLCAEAREWRFAAVCVHPARVAAAVACLTGSHTGVCAVVGFPSGAHDSLTKAHEAQRAAGNGVTAIDMVAGSGLLLDGDVRAYAEDIVAVRRAIGDRLILKVIIEAPLLGPHLMVEAARLAVQSGADYVKTSTGVYAQARLEDVRLLRSVLEPRIKIKAAGGIRTAAFALDLIVAGADRIGTSRSVEIIQELD
jgi:deoxyribose-phosphate aldolase